MRRSIGSHECSPSFRDLGSCKLPSGTVAQLTLCKLFVKKTPKLIKKQQKKRPTVLNWETKSWLADGQPHAQVEAASWLRYSTRTRSLCIIKAILFLRKDSPICSKQTIEKKKTILKNTLEMDAAKKTQNKKHKCLLQMPEMISLAFESDWHLTSHWVDEGFVPFTPPTQISSNLAALREKRHSTALLIGPYAYPRTFPADFLHHTGVSECRFLPCGTRKDL